MVHANIVSNTTYDDVQIKYSALDILGTFCLKNKKMSCAIILWLHNGLCNTDNNNNNKLKNTLVINICH